MAFKTFAPGVLTSSDVNTFLMRQAVITCTSTTRPTSPSEGMTIYETDTDLYMTYSGSAWEVGLQSGDWKTFTPTLSVVGGSGTDWTLGDATHSCRYTQIGNLVAAIVEIQWGSTSAYGTGTLCISGFPIADLAPTSTTPFVGSCQLRDTSAATGYPGSLVRLSSARYAIYPHGVAASFATLDGISSAKPFTWTSGDSISAHVIYERA